MEEGFYFDFEKLNVYQKTLVFIDDIFSVYYHLQHDLQKALGNNLIRAALSVANNIAEGNDKASKKERSRYFSISSDSARECVSVLIVLQRQNKINPQKYSSLRAKAREITSMLKKLTILPRTMDSFTKKAGRHW